MKLKFYNYFFKIKFFNLQNEYIIEFTLLGIDFFVSISLNTTAFNLLLRLPRFNIITIANRFHEFALFNRFLAVAYKDKQFYLSVLGLVLVYKRKTAMFPRYIYLNDL